ncbi:hypothetical protein [Lachnoclostridium phytofermentans]|uniref:Uncharacterized protein n=1 Tax=Lachnoclostridium phytofermentans (strain ATCC 700394 / DSM 18823 / ISDg) TaxID=357809 RepID=A9KTE8_LACP7|nr:hypothetical protein [Lachnoclostridium phytofermentans]ABX43778.1 hypothetical protein Cphy_3425 [Lachnoclostridium phytofermentans ISDg]
MSNTKIVVIKLKQIIYGVIFAVLGIVLLILLLALFKSSKKDSGANEDSAMYKPGVYNSVVALNDSTLNLEVIVDKNHINSVQLINLDEAITTLYPLVEKSINSIAEQLCNDVDIASIQIQEDSKYTQTLLLDAIEKTLEKALITPVDHSMDKQADTKK